MSTESKIMIKNTENFENFEKRLIKISIVGDSINHFLSLFLYVNSLGIQYFIPDHTFLHFSEEQVNLRFGEDIEQSS